MKSKRTIILAIAFAMILNICKSAFGINEVYAKPPTGPDAYPCIYMSLEHYSDPELQLDYYSCDIYPKDARNKKKPGISYNKKTNTLILNNSNFP